jgi:stalled ribosome rescue protein Dom34
MAAAAHRASSDRYLSTPATEYQNMHPHYLVWVDHREAKIFAVGIEDTGTHTIIDQGPIHHVHSKPDHVERARSSAERNFLAEIANALLPAKAIMIVGPGNARTELGDFLEERFPAIAKLVWTNETVDHPTAPQLIARARDYFRAEANMHGSP